MSACWLCEEKRHLRAYIKACYEAAHRAIRLARAYRAEPGTSGRREDECVRRADGMRRTASMMRAKLRGIRCVVEHEVAA